MVKRLMKKGTIASPPSTCGTPEIPWSLYTVCTERTDRRMFRMVSCPWIRV